MRKNKRAVLCAIITATAVNLTAVAPAYAAARELPKPTLPNPPAANDETYKKPDFKKLSKQVAKNSKNLKKVFKNPYQWGGQLALEKVIDQVGKLMESAGEVQWKDKDGNTVDIDDPNADTDNARPSGSKKTQSTPPGAYPYEFAFDGQGFDTAEAVHQYITTTYLKKEGLKRTRRSDGLYYDRINVYFKRTPVGIGQFVSSVQVANEKAKYKNNVGGTLVQFYGTIYYKGELSEKNTEVSPDFQQDLVDQIEDVLKKAYNEAPAGPETKTQPLREFENAPQGPQTKPDTKKGTDKDKDPSKKPNPDDKTKPDTKKDPNDDTEADPDKNPDPDKDPDADPKKDPDDKEDTDETPFENPKPNPRPDINPNPGWGGSSPDRTSDRRPDRKDDKDPQPNPETKFELPTFCDWATPVCGFIDWLKEEPQLPEPTKPKLVEYDDSWLAPAEKSWVNFGSATCPQDIIIPIQFGNNSQNITISYVPFCKFAQMIKPAVILGAYLSALMIIVGGRQREG